jgi:uncharacterized protein (TIGR02217 family)
MSFFETEFPRTISYKATGGPGFNTTVNAGLSGAEQRNKNWAQALGGWQVSLITPASFSSNRAQFLNLLRSFFLNVSGMGDGFRLFDHVDNNAVNSLIGTGDGVTAAFQLVKGYVIGGRTYVKTINKPITSSVKDYQGNSLTDTVVVYRAGVADPTSRWSVDYTTGVVTFKTASGTLSLSNPVFNAGPNTTTYTWSLNTSSFAPAVGQRIVITGFAHSVNNGTFYISAVTGVSSGTLTVNNAAGSTQTETGSGVLSWIPKTGDQINADFSFHYPVRFDTDKMEVMIDESDVKDGNPIVNWANIALKELRISAGQSDG